ncbi:MAG TPA: SgcJ/EcaC family oxidoreductase [Pseudonocardiaceae bacterium]|nr:SgcJ/EcaC family oxidoreductase [Pseudonocardiaceae bacterium]
MSVTIKASELLADAGIVEDVSYYRSFNSEDEKAVLTVPMKITAGWARNDADFFASIFVENGSLLMQDTQLTSREQIREFMAAGFQGPLQGAQVSGGPLEIKFLRDNIAMVITEGGIILAGESAIAPERQIRATWIIVDEGDGVWKLFSHQSSPAPYKG